LKRLYLYTNNLIFHQTSYQTTATINKFFLATAEVIGDNAKMCLNKISQTLR